MKNWQELKKELLRDSKVKSEYKKLEPEYKLAQELLRARYSKKLTQTELAKMAGTSQVIISRLESGDYNPTIETVNKIASALGKELKLVPTK